MSVASTPAVVPAHCPVCDHRLAAPFYDGGAQTLATLGWPRSAAEAAAMPRHPQDFVQCPACSHVWNRSFSYDAIPYENKPNRMFNKGGVWKDHLARSRDVLLQRLPARPTVVEIGCGEGHFIRGLAQSCNGIGRFAGFDPNAGPETGVGIEFHARLYDPLTDMDTLAPDAIVIRHVLEHLSDPAALIEQLAWGAAKMAKPCWLFAEVPCIDRVFATGRLADFFYEHMSHFTTGSFQTLLARGGAVAEMAHGYDGEVVSGMVALGVAAAAHKRASAAHEFAVRADASRCAIRAQLDALAASGATVAIWGAPARPPRSFTSSAPTRNGFRSWSTPIRKRPARTCPAPRR